MKTVKRRDQLLLKSLVTLASLHSVALGIMLIVMPAALLSLFGWEVTCEPFFLRQVGLFHLLLGFFYFYEWSRFNRIVVLITAKLAAVVFLTAYCIASPVEIGVVISDIIDALFGVSALVLWFKISANPQR